MNEVQGGMFELEQDNVLLRRDEMQVSHSTLRTSVQLYPLYGDSAEE